MRALYVLMSPSELQVTAATWCAAWALYARYPPLASGVSPCVGLRVCGKAAICQVATCCSVAGEEQGGDLQGTTVRHELVLRPLSTSHFSTSYFCF